MNKKHIHLLIGIVIIALSLFYAFRGVEISELKSALMQANYAYLLPAIFIVAITFLFRAMRWRFLIRSVKEVKTTDLFSETQPHRASQTLTAIAPTPKNANGPQNQKPSDLVVPELHAEG